jgi:folate-binding protein YgfZ
LILSPQGHVERELLLVDDGERTWIDTEASEADPLIAYLEKMKFMMQVVVTRANDEYQLIRAAGAADELGGPYQIIKRGEFPTAPRAGIWALEALRVEQGRARLGFEVDYKSIPNELGYLGRSVHMRKGCYRGQETVAKVFNLGHPPRRLVRLQLDGSEIDLPASGAKVMLGESEVGYIGTVARHYEQGPIALAVVRRTVPITAELSVDGIAALQEVIVAPE